MCDEVEQVVNWDVDISDAEFEKVALEFVEMGLLELVVHEDELGFRLTPMGRIALDIPPTAVPGWVPTPKLISVDPIRLTESY